MTYYEAYTRVKKLAATAEGKDAEALRMAAEVLLQEFDDLVPVYNGNEYRCPNCGGVVFPDDCFCSQCGRGLDFDAVKYTEAEK